ncbi:TPA: hypothetical protein N0F65_006400 [Lagenidium giganteum]|uniref:F-box domain-containing protein n=1 Tax=Lagenidium giganteum TaxID=4803 RepID=A0AAV2YL88_9STRA|nr:TPA: hypothetical protein N0F65_006400 [Lagenidium giganteum]
MTATSLPRGIDPAIALPLATMRAVLAFAGATCPPDPLRERCCSTQQTPPASTMAMLSLRAVAASWRRVVDELMASHQRYSETLVVAESMEMAERAAKDVLHLRICATHTATAAVDWPGWMQRYPALQRLDLSCVPVASGHLPAILSAASKSCVDLKSLRLPCCVGDGNQSRQVSDEAVDALVHALERWHCWGARLRHIFVPRLPRPVDTFLRELAQYCPQIESLDGLGQSEQWLVSLDTWKLFSASCTLLRAFHWRVVPFEDAFLSAFGRSCKPKLETLRIGFNMDSQFTLATGAYSVPGVVQLLRGVPALRVLEMNFPFFVDVTQVVSDGVFIELARHCPRLAHLHVKLQRLHEPLALDAVTSVGIDALLQLPALDDLELHGLMVPPKRLVAFLIEKARRTYGRLRMALRDYHGDMRALVISLVENVALGRCRVDLTVTRACATANVRFDCLRQQFGTMAVPKGVSLVVHLSKPNAVDSPQLVSIQQLSFSSTPVPHNFIVSASADPSSSCVGSVLLIAPWVAAPSETPVVTASAAGVDESSDAGLLL